MTKMKWAAAAKGRVQELLWPSHPSAAVESKLLRTKGRWRDCLWKKSGGKEGDFVAKGG